MEFTPEFAVIQGTLLTIQKKVGLLKSLACDDSRFAEKKQIVVKALVKTLNSIENVDYMKDGIKLRQISLFLVLNSNLRVCELLMEDPYCGHLVNSAPVISIQILLDIFREPVCCKYFQEILIYCPSVVGVELLDALKPKLKTHPLTTGLSWVAMCTKAIYIKLLTLQNKSGVHKCEIDCVALKFMSFYTECLELFQYPAISECSEDNGQRLLITLELVTSCLEFFISPVELCDEMLDVYKMNVTFDYKMWHQQSDVSLFDILHEQLFSILLMQVAHISVDMWLQWAELNLKCSDNSSLQKDIAEKMYECHGVLAAAKRKGIISEVLEGLIPMLTSMACKPRDEDDEIMEADIGLILRRIPDEKFSQKKWLIALLKICDNAIMKEESIECLERNIHLIDHEVISLFLEKIFKCTENAEVDNVILENVKCVFLCAVTQLSLSEQIQLLEEFLNKFGISTHLCSSEYSSKIIKVLNTAVNTTEVSHDKQVKEFVNLSLQNPLDVMIRLLKHAVASDKQANIMGDILLTLKPFYSFRVYKNEPESCHLLVKILNDIMQKKSDMEFSPSSFISFVTRLATHCAIPIEDFLKDNLLPEIHKNLINQHWSDLTLWLETLQVFVDGTVESNNVLDSPTLLLVLAQIMESSRQSFYSFSYAAVIACDHAINIVSILVESFVSDIKDAELKCFSGDIEWVSPINKFYFFDLLSNHENYSNFIPDWKVYLLHWKCDLLPPWGSRGNLQRKKLIFELAQLLPTCGPSEWQTIAQSLRNLISPTFCETSSTFTFECLIDAIQILVMLCTASGLMDKEQECAISCLDFCIRNLSTLVKEEFSAIPESVSPKAVSLLFLKIIDLIYVLPSSVKESCEGVLLNMLVSIISLSTSNLEVHSNEEDEERDLWGSEWRNMTLSVTILEDLKFRQALACKLQEGLSVLS